KRGRPHADRGATIRVVRERLVRQLEDDGVRVEAREKVDARATGLVTEAGAAVRLAEDHVLERVQVEEERVGAKSREGTAVAPQGRHRVALTAPELDALVQGACVRACVTGDAVGLRAGDRR